MSPDPAVTEEHASAAGAAPTTSGDDATAGKPGKAREAGDTEGTPAGEGKARSRAGDDEAGGSEPAPPPTVREPARSPEAGDRRTPRTRAKAPAEEAAAPDPTDTPAATATAAASVAVGGATTPPLVTVEEAMSRRQRRKAVRLRARKVKRIVRRLDPWSVLKVSFVFYLCVYVVSLVSSIILWKVASDAGVVDNVEDFIEDLGAFETFSFEPDKLLNAVAIGGAVMAVLATGLTALGSVLFNLISDLVGGIRLTVIEEPGSKPLVKRRPRPVRAEAPAMASPRPEPAGRPAPVAPAAGPAPST